MNVTGVNAAQATAGVPAVTRPPEATTGPQQPRKPSTEDAAQAAAAAAAAAAAEQRKAAEKLPPLKPLSLTEVRVMLGAIPPGHATGNETGVKGGRFDAYA